MSNLTNLIPSNEEEILTEVVEGSLKSLESEEIEANTLYSVKDFPIGGITNKQMADALTEDQAGFYQKNSVYLCLDNGTYTKNKFYRFTNYAWTECEVSKEYTAGTGITIADNIISASVASVEYKNAAEVLLGQLKFVKCNRAEYDALETKDENTFYIIIG